MRKTWVVVADNSRARIFTAETPSSPLIEVDSIVHPEGRMHDRDITSDLPGRGAGTGGSRHSYETETDAKDYENVSFARRIANFLDDARKSDKFKQLIIVAAPALLGNLRSGLNDQTRKMVSLELDKNLSQLNPDDIRKHMPEFLPNK
ncbi:MAG: host attachment protein [Gammaproteobacteria bacterium]|jgi:protein required for attachment to host cells